MINEIITKIAKDESFKVLCKKITNNSSVWEDLHQDVLLRLLEKQQHTIKAHNEGYLDVYVVGVIYNKWNDRLREKSKSKLILVADNYGYWSEYKDYLAPDKTKHLKHRAVLEVKKQIASGNEDALLLWRACHSNMYTVSKEENTSFYQIKKKVDPIKKQIKRKLE